jgi:ketosteroid isomerase-like protein
MSLTLPEPISAYFIADAATPDAVAACFTPDATVIDERQTHQGRDAITRWKQEASARYNYTAEPISISAQGSEQIVIAHLTGDFPGSPVDLRYAFTLDRGAIARLEITA